MTIISSSTPSSPWRTRQPTESAISDRPQFRGRCNRTEGEEPLAVKIRLSRVGATKHPSYRVVVIDSRRPRDGRALEIIGFYDPLTDPATVRIDTARVDAWVSKGARPSDTVARLLKLAQARPAGATAEADVAPAAPKPARPTRARKTAAKPAAE